MSNEKAFESNLLEAIDVDSLDGEAGAAVDVILGLQRSPCGKHNSVITKDDIYGYGHKDGLSDASGRSWWLVIRCSECGYDYNHQHWAALLE